MIVYLYNLKAGILFGALPGLKVCTCARYLGGFIGGDASTQEWIIVRTAV